MSIRAKTCFAFVLAASLCRGQVDVSGTVRDYLDGKAIPGATVRVVGAAGHTNQATTDSSGTFRFTAASGLPLADPGNLPGIARQGRDFLFTMRAAGGAEVRIHPLTGRGSVPVFAGRLEAGLWRIGQPRLPAGIYFCRIRTPEGDYAAKFLATDMPPRPGRGLPERIGAPAPYPVDAPRSAAMAKRGNAAARTDSLIITRPGYHPRNVSLDSLPRIGLVVHMTDTAIGKSATLVPDASWNCGLPAGIAPPTKGAAVFRATLTLGAIHPVGITPYGYRRLLDVSGGTFAGTRINGTVHKGGLDLELTQRDGTVEIEQILILRAGDGANIYVRGLGVAMPGDPTGRVVLDFEAPTSGAHAWLNTGTYVATRVVDPAAKTLELAVFDVSGAATGNPRIRLADPPGVPQQSPDCLTLSGSRGTAVFTENVTLGASFSIAGKRGARNVIPITGGTTTGRVAGKVLAGGADYQLNGLDARYTLAPDDGEFILVRNCGPMNGLIPRFEARVAGPYNFLNANTFLSSEPGVSGSSVNITFYQRR